MTTYVVELDDRAQDEADAIFFRLSARLGPDFASFWYDNLFKEMDSLAVMPHRWAIAEYDGEAYPYTEVRRMLSGRGTMIFRILFHIIEPLEGEIEGIVRVLRVRHAAMRPLGQPDGEAI